MYTVGSKILKGKYSVIEVLGSGAFGRVYRVSDNVTRQEWALKRIYSEAPQKLFMSEVKVMHQLKNGPHILPYHEYLYDSDGTMLILSRYMNAGNLLDLITTKGAMSEGDFFVLLAQMSAALDHAQSLSPPVHHKDIKPENILGELDSDAEITWYLADWGLSEAKESSGTSAFSGTYAYTAPEVFRSRRHLNSDIYSLGMTMYHALFGALPFDARNNAEWMYYHLNEEVHLSEKISPYVSELFLGMLQKDPEKRWNIKRVIEHLKKGKTSEKPPTVVFGLEAFQKHELGGSTIGGVRLKELEKTQNLETEKQVTPKGPVKGRTIEIPLTDLSLSEVPGTIVPGADAFKRSEVGPKWIEERAHLVREIQNALSTSDLESARSNLQRLEIHLGDQKDSDEGTRSRGGFPGVVIYRPKRGREAVL